MDRCWSVVVPGQEALLCSCEVCERLSTSESGEVFIQPNGKGGQGSSWAGVASGHARPQAEGLELGCCQLYRLNKYSKSSLHQL